MIREREVFELKDQILHDVFFDKEMNFAGFKFKNAVTKEHTHMTAMIDDYLHYIHNDDRLFEEYHEHVRIVGFRTTKACASSAKIMSVQPIYFASGKMCKNSVLLPLTPGLLDEMPSYGPECLASGQPSMSLAASSASGSGGSDASMQALVFLVLMLVLFLVCA